jgi:hypothetical protein
VDFCPNCGAKDWDPSTVLKPDAKAKQSGSDAGSVGCALAILVLAAVGLALWDYAKEQGYLYHDEMTTVSSRFWTKGEYKNCTSINAKRNEPFLECYRSDGGDVKEFKVRFYGPTQSKDKPEPFLFDWKCRKNGDEDPTMTCEIAR